MSKLPFDKTVKLEINGSNQQIRMCAERAGLPPLLIVQAGPGLPLLNEVTKFRRHLHLESDFLVSYWDQRGCGIASAQDAKNVSLQQQVADLRAILRWSKDETKQMVIVFAISLGATIALQAVENEVDTVKSVIAISPDADTAASDAAVYSPSIAPREAISLLLPRGLRRGPYAQRPRRDADARHGKWLRGSIVLCAVHSAADNGARAAIVVAAGLATVAPPSHSPER
jgi:alpha-beta hydrolase superfamily lysophospholipase